MVVGGRGLGNSVLKEEGLHTSEQTSDHSLLSPQLFLISVIRHMQNCPPAGNPWSLGWACPVQEGIGFRRGAPL